MPAVRGEVKRYIIVNSVFRQSHVDGTVEPSVDKNVDSCVVVRFLHRKQQILSLAVYSYDGIVCTQMVYFHTVKRRCTGHDRCQSKHHHDRDAFYSLAHCL